MNMCIRYAFFILLFGLSLSGQASSAISAQDAGDLGFLSLALLYTCGKNTTLDKYDALLIGSCIGIAFLLRKKARECESLKNQLSNSEQTNTTLEQNNSSLIQDIRVLESERREYSQREDAQRGYAQTIADLQTANANLRAELHRRIGQFEGHNGPPCEINDPSDNNALRHFTSELSAATATMTQATRKIDMLYAHFTANTSEPDLEMEAPPAYQAPLTIQNQSVEAYNPLDLSTLVGIINPEQHPTRRPLLQRLFHRRSDGA